MEQPLATPHRFKKPATFLVVLLALWLLPSLAILQLSRSYNNSLAHIEELGIRVTELRQSLYFSEPLRVSRINDLALDAQLVYSIRLQIESDFEHAFFRPDVNQLLYVADQFLEKFDEFIPIESQVQAIVDNIKALRTDSKTSSKLKPLLNEFGVVVFEAMYSDNESSSATYRSFDSILKRSYSLKTKEQEAMQQLLADASALLGDYAQLNYLVDKIKKNSVNEQIIKLEAQFHKSQFNLLLAALGLSLLAMIALVLWGVGFKKSVSQAESDSGRELETNLGKPASSSNATANQVETTDSKDTFSDVKQANHVAAAPERAQSIQHSVNESTAVPRSHQESGVHLAEKHVASVTDSKPAIDIEEMLETLDDDAESVSLLLGVFVQDHADDCTKLKSLLTKDDTSAARIVHSLKGVAGSIKASRLAIIAASIEMTMKQSRAVSEYDLEELEQAIQASVDSAMAYLDQSH